MEDFLAKLAFGAAIQSFYTFTLVLIRMAGLMTVGPVFGQRIVPMNVRALLVVALSVLLAPTLAAQSRVGFSRLDENADGILQRDEVPAQLLPRYDRLHRQAGKRPAEGLTREEFEFHSLRLEVPPTVVDYAWIAVGEFALGLVLGLGVFIILSGLQLAGELIDQQTGFSLGQVFNPGFEVSSSVTGQFLFLFGVVLLLTMEPFNGHLLLVGSLVETFQTLPVGEALVTESTVDLLKTLVHQSLVLGIQVAAPLLAVMSLVALTMGFLGHTVPQLNILVIGFPIRISISLLILTLTISGVAERLVDLIPEVIDSLRESLTGLP